MTLDLKAAALLSSLTNNHALVDGNKRLNRAATAVFLDLNGARPKLTDGEAFDLVWEIAVTALGSSRSFFPSRCREPSEHRLAGPTPT